MGGGRAEKEPSGMEKETFLLCRTALHFDDVKLSRLRHKFVSVVQLEKIRNLLEILLHSFEYPKCVGVAPEVEFASFSLSDLVRPEMDRHFLVRDPGPAEIQLDPDTPVRCFPEETDVF